MARPTGGSRLLCALALAAAVTSGCSAENAYVANRAGDFADLIRGHVMWGEGGALKVDAMQIFQFGINEMRDASAWGIHHRAVGSWVESTSAWGFLIGHHDERVRGIDALTGSYGWSFEDGAAFHSGDPGNPLDWFTLRITLALYAGLDLELRFGEAIDFVFGLADIDLANDDRGA